MSQKLTSFLAFLAVAFANAVATETPLARIAKFSGDRAAAISYTFDDNLRDQFTVGVPMLNEVGFKGTFFVIASKTAETPEEAEKKFGDPKPRNQWGSISWPELKQMSDQGHEIASHTWSHPGLQKLTPEQVDAEFSKAFDAIKSHIGKPPLTIGFPFNQSTPEIQAAALKYHVAYRSAQLGAGGKATAETMNKWADKQFQEKTSGVVMVHAVSKGYAQFDDPEAFRSHLKYVKSREKEVWVDTFANVSRYEKERDQAKLTTTGKAGNITVSLTSPLDPQIYDVPLTIILEGKNAKIVQAKRGDKELPSRIENGSIFIEAAPSDQTIHIQWK